MKAIPLSIVLALVFLRSAGFADAASAPGQDPIAGHWIWAEGVTVELSENGQARLRTAAFGLEGKWAFASTENGERKYVITWQGGQWIDSMTLSTDDRHLFGQNQLGWKLNATREQAARETAAPVESASPPSASAPEPGAASPKSAPAAAASVPEGPAPGAKVGEQPLPNGRQEAPSPWLVLGNEEKYIFLGKAVWDVDTGKPLAGSVAPQIFGLSHPIKGVADHFFSECANHGTPDLPSVGFIYSLDGTYPKVPSLTGTPGNNGVDFPGYWVNSDRRRVVWIEQGDYWRGEIDWASVQIINRKRATNAGSFQPMNRPLLWWGQLLFVYGGFDQDKPIVRIDLATGAVDELDTEHAWTKTPPGASGINALSSPTFCRVVNITPTVIYSYDVRTGKTTSIYNELELGRHNESTAESDTAVWDGDDLLYTVSLDGLVTKIDLRNARMTIVCEPQTAPHELSRPQTRLQSIVPGGRYADFVTVLRNPSAVESFKERFLVDLTNGKRKTLPLTNREYGQWIDTSRFIYIRDSGGLSSVGTWLYDASTDSNKRLTGIKIDLQRGTLLKKRNEFWAVTQQAGTLLVRLKLGDGSAENLGPCSLDVPMTMPAGFPIDLGFGANASAALWKPVVIDPTSLLPTEPPIPPKGKLIVLEQTRNLPREQRQYAENAYDYAVTNVLLGGFYDPAKFAAIALAAHLANPTMPFVNTIPKLDLSHAADRSRAFRYARSHASSLLATSQIALSAEQKEAVADRIAAAVADAFVRRPAAEMRYIDAIFGACFTRELNAARAGQR